MDLGEKLIETATCRLHHQDGPRARLRTIKIKTLESKIKSAFRRHWGGITSRLARQFGAEKLDMVEAATQDAFLKALEKWPIDGEPDNAEAWLYSVARNGMLDHVRKAVGHVAKEAEVTRHVEQTTDGDSEVARLEGELSDEQLRMLFVCCHPSLPEDARVPLTLRTLCGFDIPELARAFLVSEDALAKRLVRARSQLREILPRFELPDDVDLESRLDSVLKVLYLIFNEGYSARSGDDILRCDVADEAIRLAKALCDHERTARPATQALLALMLLQASRFDTRVDADGLLLDLWEQDRGKWDRMRIQSGLTFLQRAATGNDLTSYHLEAMIAACHARARSAEATNWALIGDLYDKLFALNPSPVVALNQAVALGFGEGVVAGLERLRKLGRDKTMAGYYLYYVCLGDFEARNGNPVAARTAFGKALELAFHPAEKAAISKKLGRL